jgi:hypothetical protein
VPVPPGFTIAASVCIDYLQRWRYPDALRDEVATQRASAWNR